MRRSGPFRAALLAWVAWSAVALAIPAGADEQPAQRVGLRVGNHPTHGRVVFDWPDPVQYRVERRGDRVTLRFGGAAAGVGFDLGAAAGLPRNVAALGPTEGGFGITLRPGARLRHFRLGTMVVLDALDPEPETSATAAAAEPPAMGRRTEAESPAVQPVPGTSATRGADGAAATGAAGTGAPPPAATAVPSPSVAATAAAAAPEPPPVPIEQPSRLPAVSAAASAPRAGAAPVTLPEHGAAVVRLTSDPDGARAIHIPFADGIGAAAFRRGGSALVLFDAPRALDLAALRDDPVFGAAEAWTTADATVLRLPVAAPGVLRPHTAGAGWSKRCGRRADLPPPPRPGR